MQFEFNGVAQDASTMKDYLEPQFRAAKETDLKTSISFDFEGGLRARRGRRRQVHRKADAFCERGCVCRSDGGGEVMRAPRRKDEFMMVSKTQPVYELRARRHGPGDTEIEVWQLPRWRRRRSPPRSALRACAVEISNWPNIVFSSG